MDAVGAREAWEGVGRIVSPVGKGETAVAAGTAGEGYVREEGRLQAKIPSDRTRSNIRRLRRNMYRGRDFTLSCSFNYL